MREEEVSHDALEVGGRGCQESIRTEVDSKEAQVGLDQVDVFDVDAEVVGRDVAVDIDGMQEALLLGPDQDGARQRTETSRIGRDGQDALQMDV